MLDPVRRLEVAQTFPHLAQDTVTAAFTFYETLFAACPHLRGLFPEDMAPQAAKLASSLSTLIASLESADMLDGYLRDLGARHAARGVRPGHYPAVCDALLETLSATPGWNAERAEAWSALLSQVSARMVAGAEPARA